MFKWLRRLFEKEGETEAIDPERREFLRISAATIAAAAFWPFKVSAQEPEVIIVTISSRDRNRKTLWAIVNHYCHEPTVLKYYNTTNINVALKKLARFNGIKDVHSIPNGQKIKIPKVLCNKRVRKVEKKLRRVQRTQTTGFQSPFGGRKRPILHKCYKDRGSARICPYDKFKARGGRHGGLDVYCKIGTKLYPILPGKVHYVQPKDLYPRGGREGNNGIHFRIKSPGGFSHMYLHLSKTLVKKGQQVDYNTIIGLSGISGNLRKSGKVNPHVHVQLQKHGSKVDPLKYLDFLR